MTRTQLQTLYSFANLPYSEQSENLNDLRKYLLLELKDDQVVLSIQGKSWSKNDVLVFFEGELLARTFDYAQFIEDFPWIKRLENMDAITFDESLLAVNLNDARFIQFAEQESRVYEEDFMRFFIKYIKNHNFAKVLGLLQYKHLFLEKFQTELNLETELILRNLFTTIYERWLKGQLNVNDLQFYLSPYYYIFLKAIPDSGIRLSNYDTLYKVMYILPISQLEEIIEYQKAMKQNFEDEIAYRKIVSRLAAMRWRKPSSYFTGKKIKRFFGNKTKVLNTTIFLICIFVLYKYLNR